jgi:hypothetical protein
MRPVLCPSAPALGMYLDAPPRVCPSGRDRHRSMLHVAARGRWFTIDAWGVGTVNYPLASARGLHLGRFTLTPSGALLPVHPYRVRIRRPVDCLRGAVRPVDVQAAPTIPLAPGRFGPQARSLPLDVTTLRTRLAVTPRDSSNRAQVFYIWQVESSQKGGALRPLRS